MTASNSAQIRPRVVGVIASGADLDCALQMRTRPDLFELRLDRLADIIEQLENKLSRLRAPLIITARHPQEGGAKKLTLGQRRDLLTRFLPHAEYVDVELRSAFALRSLLGLAQEKRVRRIISFHNLRSTPPLRVLAAKANAARAHGANIFKAATRTDTPNQLSRLLQLVATEVVDLPVSAMGIGNLGAISRVLLARAGSVLVYASITARSDLEGQLSLEQLRALGMGSPG
jgi:3-dehydroquinate dehydratase-1